MTGVVLAATLQAAKQAQDFLAAAPGHKGDSLGTILGDMIHRRQQRARITFERYCYRQPISRRKSFLSSGTGGSAISRV
jgi:hypothetical protein